MNRPLISCLAPLALSFLFAAAAENTPSPAPSPVDADGRVVVVTSEIPLPTAENAGIKFVALPEADELAEPRIFGVAAKEFGALLPTIHAAGLTDPEVLEVNRQIQMLEMRRMILSVRRALSQPSDKDADLKRILTELEANEKALKVEGDNLAK